MANYNPDRNICWTEVIRSCKFMCYVLNNILIKFTDFEKITNKHETCWALPKLSIALPSSCWQFSLKRTAYTYKRWAWMSCVTGTYLPRSAQGRVFSSATSCPRKRIISTVEKPRIVFFNRSEVTCHISITVNFKHQTYAE